MFTDIFNQEKNVTKFEMFVSIYFDIDYDKVKGNLKLLPRDLSKDKKEEARKENKLEIAKNMLEEKIDVETITRVTKLSIDEINKLK